MLNKKIFKRRLYRGLSGETLSYTYIGIGRITQSEKKAEEKEKQIEKRGVLKQHLPFLIACY